MPCQQHLHNAGFNSSWSSCSSPLCLLLSQLLSWPSMSYPSCHCCCSSMDSCEFLSRPGYNVNATAGQMTRPQSTTPVTHSVILSGCPFALACFYRIAELAEIFIAFQLGHGLVVFSIGRLRFELENYKEVHKLTIVFDGGIPLRT